MHIFEKFKKGALTTLHEVQNPEKLRIWPNQKQAASCKGEGFKKLKLRKEGLKGLEKFKVGK